MKEKIKGLLAGIIFRLIALLTLGQISPILSACVIIEQDGKILLIDRWMVWAILFQAVLCATKRRWSSVCCVRLGGDGV